MITLEGACGSSAVGEVVSQAPKVRRKCLKLRHTFICAYCSSLSAGKSACGTCQATVTRVKELPSAVRNPTQVHMFLCKGRLP